MADTKGKGRRVGFLPRTERPMWLEAFCEEWGDWRKTKVSVGPGQAGPCGFGKPFLFLGQ